MSTKSESSSFGQTLQFITSIKLQELEKQRLAYQAHAKVVDEAKKINDPIAKVELLSKAVKAWSGSGTLDHTSTVGGKLNLSNLPLWLKQAKKDPSFSKDIVRGWGETLEQHIEHTMMKFDCAKLFGRLFNEWLASGDSSTVAYQGPGKGESSEDAESEMFVDVGRKEMHEQKDKLESIIFDEKVVDTEKLREYLEELFEGDEQQKALERLRKEVRDFGGMLQRRTLGRQDVINAIKGLLATGLMDEEKRSTLKEFLENPTVLDEVASVLNMRMASLDTWSWPEKGITVEMRRHLNGKYRAFTDPEIVDALLLHHLGVAWQVRLKMAFRQLFDSKAWKRTYSPPTHKERERRTQQLREDDGTSSIESQQNMTRKQHFLLSQLSDASDRPSTYDDLVDAPEEDGANGDRLTPAAVKQKLLHIMTTECYLNTALHKTHAVVRSDLEWFGPSLPHSSILAVLEFFGMPNQWREFFRAFLEAPLKFSGDKEVRVRKRGTPISYALSVVCGEAILFGMDFAVNQKADGLFLYRMHDDLWIWDADAKKCATGWKEMNRYAELVGLKFNQKKTGSACVGMDGEGLPEGDIRWGFLKFDPAQKRFVLDQNDVDHHIAELRHQLASTKSVFGWVNAYNKYMAFFVRNFGGRPARCFGDAHTEDIIDTLARIQRELFPDRKDGAVGYLRKVLEERFDMRDLPEGYFYFPIGSGGLELKNPMLELFALEARSEDEPPAEEVFIKEIKKDEETYKHLKEVWEIDADSLDSSALPIAHDSSWGSASPIAHYSSWAHVDYSRGRGRGRGRGRAGYAVNTPRFSLADEFLSFEEFTSLRKSWLMSWGNRYSEMLYVKEPRLMTLSPALQAAFDSGPRMVLTWYERWVVSLYGEELANKFGGLEVVDRSLIPVGMVQLFRSARMKLDE